MRRNHANTDGNICLLPNLSEIMKLEFQMRRPPRNIIVLSCLSCNVSSPNKYACKVHLTCIAFCFQLFAYAAFDPGDP